MRGIIDKFNNQSRFDNLDEYLKYMRIGIEDGWMVSSSRELKSLYKLIKIRSKPDENYM